MPSPPWARIRGDPGVRDDRSMIVEPVEVARCDIEPEEVVVKPLSLVAEPHVARAMPAAISASWKLFELELSSPPAEPGEALGVLARNGRVHMKDATVERRSFHRRSVARQEFDVGLIPAELDQLAGSESRRDRGRPVSGVRGSRDDSGPAGRRYRPASGKSCLGWSWTRPV